MSEAGAAVATVAADTAATITAGPPRIVVAGVHSGAGKTTFTCAILAALRRRGLRVAPFKAGPDYIDPTYHARAAGQPCRNLDTWMLPAGAVRALFERAAARAGCAVIEGVMGLYDGRGAADASGAGEDEGSTAHLAKLLDAPVLLVADASGASRTVAAVVLGCLHFDPQVRLAGVLLAGIASPRHLDLVAGPITRATGVPVLGYLPRRPEFALPERHLGLVPAGEQGVDDAFFERLAAQAEATLDLDRIVALARAAPPLALPRSANERPLAADAAPPAAPPFPLDPVSRETPLAPHAAPPLFPPVPLRHTPPVRIALALDDAFHFYYEDGLDLLRAHGAELVPFSPLHDGALPDGIGAVYLGGGFPEVYAGQLAANLPLLHSLRAAAAAGLPIYGECGGLMYLAQGIVDQHGARHAMAGIVPGWSHMGQPRVTLGYRVARARVDSPLLAAGQAVRGHEFHWSALAEPVAEPSAAYTLTTAAGAPLGPEGYAGGPRRNVLASYVHLHFGADPALAARFVAAARAAPSLPSS